MNTWKTALLVLAVGAFILATATFVAINVVHPHDEWQLFLTGWIDILIGWVALLSSYYLHRK